ncbi:MAG: amino acid permease, partial [Phaeodactylibacter sp.]|nr:amino acid permease [Phaeodactylibacter sp.]
SWRPSAVAISEDSFQRLGAFDLLRWISQKYGFGTYIHQIDGYLSRKTNEEAQHSKQRLIRMAEASNSNIYVDTLVSPSFTSSVAQIIQLPGVAGTENNLLIFEFSKNKPDRLVDIIDNFKLTRSVDFDMLILGSSERGYGLKQQIHIWITANDYHNANLMILLAYIILGHRDWSKGQIKIFAVYPEGTIQDEKERLFRLIEAGQLPISPNNIELITQKQELSVRSIVNEKSQDADLTIIGFREEMVKHAGKEIFEDYEAVGNVLFVNTAEGKNIK